MTDCISTNQQFSWTQIYRLLIWFCYRLVTGWKLLILTIDRHIQVKNVSSQWANLPWLDCEDALNFGLLGLERTQFLISLLWRAPFYALNTSNGSMNVHLYFPHIHTKISCLFVILSKNILDIHICVVCDLFQSAFIVRNSLSVYSIDLFLERHSLVLPFRLVGLHSPFHWSTGWWSADGALAHSWGRWFWTRTTGSGWSMTGRETEDELFNWWMCLIPYPVAWYNRDGLTIKYR